MINRAVNMKDFSLLASEPLGNKNDDIIIAGGQSEGLSRARPARKR